MMSHRENAVIFLMTVFFPSATCFLNDFFNLGKRQGRKMLGVYNKSLKKNKNKIKINKK